jgi:hypothetical protein
MVPTEAAMSDGKRQLQDLSLNDAEALQAFVAKRKWFEVKLLVSQFGPEESRVS